MLLSARSVPRRRLQSGCSLPVHCSRFWRRRRGEGLYSLFDLSVVSSLQQRICQMFLCFHHSRKQKCVQVQVTDLQGQSAASPGCGSGSCGCERRVPTAARAPSFPLFPSVHSDRQTRTKEHPSRFLRHLKNTNAASIPAFWDFSPVDRVC